MKLIVVAAVAAVLSGCVFTPRSGSVYSAYQTQNEQIVRMGYVESVREITIVQGDTGTGAMAGAAIGSITASSNVGRGSGSGLAAIAGAVVGGIIGSHVEQNLNKRKGVEITVKLDDGELRAITQEADELFQPGERVRLLSSGRSTRVTH